MYRKSTEEAVNLERDPSSVSMTSSVTASNMSANSSVIGAKRSYTSNTLATDVSEVIFVISIKLYNFLYSYHTCTQGIVLRDPLISLA